MKKSSMNEEVSGNIAVPPALAELLWVPSRERAAEILTNAKTAYTRGFTREAISRARHSYDFQPMNLWRYLKDLAEYAKVNLVDWCAGYKMQLDCEVDSASAKTLASMLNAIRLTDHVEAHLARPGGVAIAGLLGELDAPFDFAQDRIIGQDRVDVVGYGFQQMLEELPGRSPVSLVDELRYRELAGAIDTDEEIELAFGGLHLGDIDMEEADRITFEELPLRLVTLDIR